MAELRPVIKAITSQVPESSSLPSSSIESTSVALHEWAVVVDALIGGRYALIVRKGGIHEPRGGLFTLPHQRFALLGSYEHQSAERVVPSLRSQLLNQSAYDVRDAKGVTLSAWAEASAVWRITDIGMLKPMADDLALTMAECERRFHYREPWLAVIALRVFRLPSPKMLNEVTGFGGCRSWLNLPEEVELSGQPVIADQRWGDQLASWRELLSPPT